MPSPRRGDGVGVEFTPSVLRGVRLDHREPERVVAIAEVPVTVPGDEASTIDAFVRLRAELDSPQVPTRIGMFPAGSSMQRTDVTGLSGPELNRLRSDLERDHGIASTLLVDAGPRRWLFELSWQPRQIRRTEELAEEAGFLDAVVDPSPMALARAAQPLTTFARRDAADGEAFAAVLDEAIPVAAITVDTVGFPHPDVHLAAPTISLRRFDERLGPDELAVALERIAHDARGGSRGRRRAAGDDEAPAVVLGDHTYPPYPAHDVRSIERQCVAIGAAIGAAGLAGRLRPVDMALPIPIDADPRHRPWAIERLTTVPPPPTGTTIGPVKRTIARLLPRRRR